LTVDVEDLLPHVRKPTAYAGNELNIVRKDLSSLRARVALAYPDKYDIGMSNLGVRIVYHILNEHPEVACERFFAPWKDMEEILRRRGVPLFTLESRTPVREFDVVAFSVGYELTFTNMLNMLELSGIPLFSADREEDDPIVVAGGSCCLNPEPIADFIDCFFVGDGEQVVREMSEVLVRTRIDKASRSDTLRALSEIDGSYIPGLGTPQKTKRRISPCLMNEDFPGHPIVPNCETTHDRLALEIMRGCPRTCKFCQSSVVYGPVRRRSPEDILELAGTGIQHSGWEEMSLVALSPTDYPDLAGLLRNLEGLLEKTRTALSLSSVRADSLTEELCQALKIVKKTSITLAPEAGTERLRSAVGKPMPDEAILGSAARAFSLGFSRLKLYFIIGLPHETDEDVDAIASLTRDIVNQSHDGRVRVSLSSFVPKPHTPFERERQTSIEELLRKARHIKMESRSRRIEVSWHDPRVSFLEAVMSRGDRKLSKVIHGAFNRGCRFDGWSEMFDFGKWMSAFDEAEVDPESYVESMEDLRELPWSFIELGSVREKLAPPAAPSSLAPALSGLSRQTRRVVRREVRRGGRYRVRYSKLTEARFTSHLEVMRAIVRTLRRANIPLLYSQGFSSRPRVSFGPPLSVGMTSTSEYFDFVTDGPFSQDFLKTINKNLSKGLRAVSVTPVFPRSRSLSEILDVAEYKMSNVRVRPELVDQFLARESCEIVQTRGDKERTIDVRPLLLDIKMDNGGLLLKIRMPKTGWVGPREILSAIQGHAPEDFLDVEIERTGLFTYRSGALLAPTAEKVGNE
jgi:radical SAM family uncharacterized protein/radical SAM-linked protein